MTLRQIDGAKEFRAQEMNLANGAPVVMNDLWPDYIRRSTPPICTSGGTYSVNPIGTSPTCTEVGGPYSHQL